MTGKVAGGQGGPGLQQLLPFVATVAASLLWFVPVEEPGLVGMVLKCLPIVCLAVFLADAEGARGEAPIVLAAVCFSLVGDACLVWTKDYFVGGLVFFGVAQSLHVYAYGFHRVGWTLGVGLHAFNLLVLAVALPLIPNPNFRAPAAFYSVTLCTLLWRAVDRARFREDLPWGQRLCTAVGAATFCVSDLSFVTLQLGQLLPHLQAQLIILSTYYLAQLLLVLGSVKSFWAADASRRKVK